MYSWLLSYSFFFLTFNLPWGHTLFISAFQILNACINFIYHLQKQEAKTKLQAITNLQLCSSQSQEKTLDFILLILSYFAGIYEINIVILKPCPFIWNRFSIIVVISEMKRQYKKLRALLPGEFVAHNLLENSFSWYFYICLICILFAYKVQGYRLRARDIFCFYLIQKLPSWGGVRCQPIPTLWRCRTESQAIIPLLRLVS